MALILLTNDDGIRAEGLWALEQHLSQHHEVWVVAPETEMSGASHSITLHRPVTLKPYGPRKFSLSGTPADCVLVALHAVLPDRPRAVISGINAGFNVGEDVFYSGTVAGAREAALLGVPALAVSVAPGTDFQAALPFVDRVLDLLLREHRPLLLNLNLPQHRPVRGLKVVRLGNRSYVDPVHNQGGNRFVIGGTAQWQQDEGTDLWALSQGYAALTPLIVDLTSHEDLERLRRSLSG